MHSAWLSYHTCGSKQGDTCHLYTVTIGSTNAKESWTLAPESPPIAHKIVDASTAPHQPTSC